jgi:D-xylose transport system substrate-binding protein
LHRLIRITVTATLLAVACGCSGGTPSGPAGTGATAPPEITPTQMTNGSSAMTTLRAVTAEGSGKIAVLLPDTATDSSFANVASEITKAFQNAGLGTSQYTVELSTGAGQIDQAKSAIAHGAQVLIVDARYSLEGVAIEAYAQANHVKVIDFDWLTGGGSAGYYVGFDSLKVGVLLGEGLVNCVSAWGVRNPRVMIMPGGAATDYNVPLYAQGYDAVLARQFASGWKDVSNPTGTWDPQVALTEFEQQYAAHPTINAALIPNDENAVPIIMHLMKSGMKPRTFPITGLDASLLGLQNILAGYQCGTVYKPVYLEAEAAAALALYLRAGITSPSLAGQVVFDPLEYRPVPAVLLTPEWVTTRNMNSTVIADTFVTAAKLCTSRYAQDCLAAGIR